MNGRQCAPIPVFVCMSVFFLAVADITITITVIEGRLAVRRRPAYVHIETNGLHSSGTELFSLGLFIFIECWGVGRCTDLDDIRKKEARRWGGGSSLIDLRRRPKRSASEATPRILPRFRRWPPAVGVKDESAVAGRESAVPRADLANQYMCPGAPWRLHEKKGRRNVRASSESKTPCSLPFELNFALGTIEKLRRRGGPAFRESLGLADF
ncbi:hypothetical protein BGY98DRAFT_554940 [Russula aff. rugulosa BPL654]|nr:hypothetical protein BGY98DRAFT_554940 [Russula aff. rugulosa BPL654]